MNIKNIINSELLFFPSKYQNFITIDTFCIKLLEKKSWQYSDESHTCYAVLQDIDNHKQIVYCDTGFGPDFPWSVQSIDFTDLGTDGNWYAYLFEAIVMYDFPGVEKGNDFELMAKNE